MTFQQAITIVRDVLFQIGSPISTGKYDGIIIKKLEASNTLDEGRTTKQTHIAITGSQMDIFPYLRADGYFVEDDDELKKYFLVQAPITVFEPNCRYLSMNVENYHFVDGKMNTSASIVRSKRANAADQIQMSLISLDDKAFVEFRRSLHTGAFLVILKVKNRFSYHIFGVKPESATEDFRNLNNKFFKLPTNTMVNADSDFDSQEKTVKNEQSQVSYTIEDLGRILKDMYNNARESGQVAAIHMFGFKYGNIIEESNYSAKKILDAAGMGNTKYDAEISKGVNIYRSVKANEYGVSFEDLHADFLNSEEQFDICWKKLITDVENNDNKLKINLPRSTHLLIWENNRFNDTAYNYHQQFVDYETVKTVYLGTYPVKEGSGTNTVKHSNSKAIIEILSNKYGLKNSTFEKTYPMTNVYGIHITGKNNALSEENPHICIGWSKMGDLSDCTDIDSISAKHSKTWPDAKTKSRGQDVGQIYRFVLESQIGDYVVYGDGSTAHIGVIKSDYYYQENPQDQDLDYVNNKSVEWLKDVPYAELSVQFKNSLGSAMSFFRLNDYKSVVVELLNDVYVLDDDTESDVDVIPYDYKQVNGSGNNLVVYGTPGCGKSYYVMHDLLMEDQQDKEDAFKKDNIFRTTFYQDYTNTDFVGQVMPVVQYQRDSWGAEESIVTYKFVPGPFTLALECAIANPTEKVALVIEELNRGNAASIFGDLFQLLDRVDEGEKADYPLCTSEYGILNVNIVDYLKDGEHYDKKYNYLFELDEVRLPANLYIYATMNTSDQNVYTLDTAFKRRWGFEKLKNAFKDNHEYADYLVPGISNITWKQLATDINSFIVSDSNMLTAEDKQVGVYFIGKNLLIDPVTEPTTEELKNKQEKFAYKLFEYLWDDVAKFSHERWFGKINTLDELIEKYMNGEKVFVDGIISKKDK